MARRSQCSLAEDNPLDTNYVPPHYREEYRLAIDALVESDLDGYYEFLQAADVVDFLSRPEIDSIRTTVQCPCQIEQPSLLYQETERDYSSDTYWPVHSDIDAPSLDLGWPQQQLFVGPTEVTTFANPADPTVPSIKMQARKLIRNAQQVIGVAMDMFTDVDIFAELLDAAMRSVAVYILLDEQNSHHFVAMVENCRVNLDQFQYLRVRTVTGTSYLCCTGKSFKGQMMERFLLVDCQAVLGGNYSFMWSYEKIHRCIAHLYLGQLVTTFDEEFRILFAHSEPLNIQNALLKWENSYNFQTNSDMPHTTKKPTDYLPIEGKHNPEWSGHEDLINMNPKQLQMARAEPGPILVHGHVYPTQQFWMEMSYKDRGQPLLPQNPVGMSGLKRHRFGEVFQQGYYQPDIIHRDRENVDVETQIVQSHRSQHHGQRTGQDPNYDAYNAFRIQRYQPFDQYSDPDGLPEMEQSEGHNPVQKFLHSDPNVDVGHGPRNLLVPGEGPFSPSNKRRHRLGQPYTCQTSPTQPNQPDHKHFYMDSGTERKSRDTVVKQGLRDWRINSYLSGFDQPGEEEMQLLQGSELFDDCPFHSQEKIDHDISAHKLNTRDLASTLENVHPCYKKPTLPEDSIDLASVQPEIKKTSATTSESSCTGSEKADGITAKETRTKEEQFRRRPNPTLHRGSRLRHSLLFSSNLDQDKSQSTTDLTQQAKPEEPASAGIPEKPLKKQATFAIGEKNKTKQLPSDNLQRTFSFDMNDPDSRLLFFKELAAKRKAAQAAATESESITAQTLKHVLKSCEETIGPQPITNPTTTVTKTALMSSKKAENIPKVLSIILGPVEKIVSGCEKNAQNPHECEELSETATDAEKIQIKKLQTEPSPIQHELCSDSCATPKEQIKTSDDGSSPKASPVTCVPANTNAADSNSAELHNAFRESDLQVIASHSSKPVLSGDSKVASGMIQKEAKAMLPSTTTGENTKNVGQETCEKPGEGNVTREEPFRRRPNPTLQRTSKLRHSFLFSSNMEQHRSQLGIIASDENSKIFQSEGGELSNYSRLITFNKDNHGDTVDMSTPEGRLQYFRKLAAQRVAKSKQENGDISQPCNISLGLEPNPIDSPRHLKTPSGTLESSDVTSQLLEQSHCVNDAGSARDNLCSDMATDTEKIQLKKQSEGANIAKHEPSSLSHSSKSCVSWVIGQALDSSHTVSSVTGSMVGDNHKDNTLPTKDLCTSPTASSPEIFSTAPTSPTDTISSQIHSPVEPCPMSVPLSVESALTQDSTTTNSNIQPVTSESNLILQKDSLSVTSPVETNSVSRPIFQPSLCFATKPNLPMATLQIEDSVQPEHSPSVSFLGEIDSAHKATESKLTQDTLPTKLPVSSVSSPIELCLNSVISQTKDMPSATSPDTSDSASKLSKSNLSQEAPCTELLVSPVPSLVEPCLNSVISQTKDIQSAPSLGESDSARTLGKSNLTPTTELPVLPIEHVLNPVSKQPKDNPSAIHLENKHTESMLSQEILPKESPVSPVTELACGSNNPILTESIFTLVSSLHKGSVSEANLVAETNADMKTVSLQSISAEVPSLSAIKTERGESSMSTESSLFIKPQIVTSSSETKSTTHPTEPNMSQVTSPASASQSPTKVTSTSQLVLAESNLTAVSFPSLSETSSTSNRLPSDSSLPKNYNSSVTSTQETFQTAEERTEGSRSPQLTPPDKITSSKTSPNILNSTRDMFSAESSPSKVDISQDTLPAESSKTVKGESNPMPIASTPDNISLVTSTSESNSKEITTQSTESEKSSLSPVISPAKGSSSLDTAKSEKDSGVFFASLAETISGETTTPSAFLGESTTVKQDSEDGLIPTSASGEPSSVATSQADMPSASGLNIESILPENSASAKSKPLTQHSTGESTTLNVNVEITNTSEFETSVSFNESCVMKPNQTESELENGKTEGGEIGDHHIVAEVTAQSTSAATEQSISLSRLQTSTASLISCSNLRDDTKVLLGQISRASKQNIDAASKDSAGGATDEDKRHCYLGRYQKYTSQSNKEEREKVLQKMENMRKERRVYSRFEAS
ncbi:protein FAM83H [Denticeps clupeoides]|uniref:Scaffolding anchor of CK1 domain-containing protein n=1 Tax=Denticeps clupeoides TaxID=299321 RepID=A0AAY4DYS9_9TELE|nr:protein FAM83H-like [Denticeps clupeoides]